MIFQERSPRLRRRLRSVHHVLADARFADVDAELKEFSMDARCAPQRVFAAHPANQLACFDRHARTTATATTGFPRPEEAKAVPVPTDDCLWFDDDQCRTPAPPSCCQPCPQEPVRRGQLGSFHRPLQNGELMAQSEHLHLKGCAAANAIPRRCQNGQQCRRWGEEMEEDQLSMYQSDSNLREP